jgi:hypothetical protein
MFKLLAEKYSGKTFSCLELIKAELAKGVTMRRREY